MTKIVFTSCMRSEAFPEQTQWTEVADLEPDFLFILGDNVYMDYWPYTKKKSPQSMNDEQFQRLMQKKYQRQWNDQNFKSLVDQLREYRGGVYGTWDDHDFAWNNAIGEEVPESKKQISRGFFNQYFYGRPTQEPLYKVVDTDYARLIILDQRYYSQYIADDADLIGEKQIEFLARSLNHTKVFTVICGSLPLTISTSLFGINLPSMTDLWCKYRREYKRFCELVKDKKNVVYVAGDIHKNAFAKPQARLRPCFEVISSGMAVDQFASQSIFKFKKPNNAYDARKNWTLFDIDSKKIKITQSSQTSILKRKEKVFMINKR